MKIRKSDFCNLGIFLILLIAFTKSIFLLLYGGNSGVILVLSIAILLIMLSSLELRKNSIKLSLTFMDFLWGLVLVVSLYNNFDLKNNNNLAVVQLIIGTFVIFLLKGNDMWCNKNIKYIKIFTLFYLSTGFILLFLKNIQISYIVPLFNLGTSGGYYFESIINQINNGYMTGLTSHYSVMGIYLSIGMIYFAGNIFKNQEKIQLKQLAGIIVMLVGTLLSGKRSALIFPLCSILIVYMMYFKPRNLNRRVNYVLTLLLVASMFGLLLGILPGVGGTIDRIISIIGTKDLNIITNKRFEMLWIPAVQLFLEAPMFGIGWGNFKYSFTKYYLFTANQNNVHNVYLQLLCETGILGSVIILGTIFYTLYKTSKPLQQWRKRKIHLSDRQLSTLGISLAMQFYFLLYSLSGNPMYDIHCYLPYILSIAMGIAVNNNIKKYEME